MLGKLCVKFIGRKCLNYRNELTPGSGTSKTGEWEGGLLQTLTSTGGREQRKGTERKADHVRQTRGQRKKFVLINLLVPLDE